MKKPNILLVSIDTLRADHVSSYGYHRKTTPNLDRFAEEGARFNNAYSTAVWTPPAHASMLTGLYPSAHKTVDYKSLSPRIPTIAQTLSKHGYNTVGFVNNPAVGAFVGLERGHQTFHEIWKGVTSKNLAVRGGHKIYRKWLETIGKTDQGARKTNYLINQWLDTQYNKNEPFYMFVHHIEPHNPLNPPRPFRDKFSSSVSGEINPERLAKMADNPLAYFTDELNVTDAENQSLIDMYDCEIAYVDHMMGEMLDILRERNILNDTLVIITADHGEHFGEHGLYSHVSSLCEPIVHIPFMIRYPELYQPATYEVPVQHVDIFPTILELLDIEKPLQNSLPGKSLLPKNGKPKIADDRPIFAEWEGRIPEYVKNRLKDSGEFAKKVERFTHKFSMVKIKSHKFIYWEDGVEELYDLSDDHAEQNNLAPSAKEVCETMRELLMQNLSVRKNTDKNEGNQADDLVMQRLKDLGYI